MPAFFTEADLDKELQFYPAIKDGTGMDGLYHQSAWRIGFSPPCGNMTGIAVNFARKLDVELAIAALQKAGFRTGRDLIERKQERNRVIGESLLW